MKSIVPGLTDLTTKEVEAATLAVIEVWQTSNQPVGAYLDCKKVAIAALCAAETARKESSSDGPHRS